MRAARRNIVVIRTNEERNSGPTNTTTQVEPKSTDDTPSTGMVDVRATRGNESDACWREGGKEGGREGGRIVCADRERGGGEENTA
jgi:hypothetical protein